MLKTTRVQYLTPTRQLYSFSSLTGLILAIFFFNIFSFNLKYVFEIMIFFFFVDVVFRALFAQVDSEIFQYIITYEAQKLSSSYY